MNIHSDQSAKLKGVGTQNPETLLRGRSEPRTQRRGLGGNGFKNTEDTAGARADTGTLNTEKGVGTQNREVGGRMDVGTHITEKGVGGGGGGCGNPQHRERVRTSVEVQPQNTENGWGRG